MAPIHTILCPTDFSDRSTYALQLAASLARDYSARLVLLHAALPTPIVYGEGVVPLEPDSFLEEARDRLAHVAIPGANIPAERRLEEGDAANTILRVAGEIHADLIVMGTHGRTGLGRLLMGSVAEQVVRKSTCPVLTVKTPILASAPQTTTAEELVTTHAL